MNSSNAVLQILKETILNSGLVKCLGDASERESIDLGNTSYTGHTDNRS